MSCIYIIILSNPTPAVAISKDLILLSILKVILKWSSEKNYCQQVSLLNIVSSFHPAAFFLGVATCMYMY